MQTYQNWIELDLDPFITFSSNGRIMYTNNEAQFFLNQAVPKKVFELALSYAPKTYGIATNFLDLSFGNYRFYAISVGYEDDEFISIKLFKSIGAKKENLFKSKGEITNIFTLIDIIISTNSTKTKTKFIKNYDPSIPEFRISAKDFLKLINAIIASFADSEKIEVVVRLKVGEYVKISDKKHQLIGVDFISTKDANLSDSNLETLSNNCGSIIELNDKSIKLSLPLIS